MDNNNNDCGRWTPRGHRTSGVKEMELLFLLGSFACLTTVLWPNKNEEEGAERYARAQQTTSSSKVDAQTLSFVCVADQMLIKFTRNFIFISSLCIDTYEFDSKILL